MGLHTGISWCHATWNPWQGCTKVSTGCQNCYMYREKAQYGQDPYTVIRSNPKTFNAPLKWALPDKARIFVCSWSDFFHKDADEWREEAWKIIKALPQYNFLIPTKRIERAAECLPPDWSEDFLNVWLGVSTENQETFNERVPILVTVPASVRWVSAEPLLGPIDIWGAGAYAGSYLDWVVIGGESGPGCREMKLEWAEKLVRQCKKAFIPAHVKQLGGWPDVRKKPEDFPGDLCVQEFPGKYCLF